jgi:hypothetical protein
MGDQQGVRRDSSSFPRRIQNDRLKKKFPTAFIDVYEGVQREDPLPGY